MMTQHKEDPVLDDKDQEIIAVGASVASGCLPCIRFHLRAAAAAGAGEGEIRQAVGDATRVRMAATGIMARAGGLTQAEWSPVIPEPDGTPSMLRELVAIAAGYSINCSTTLGAHMAASRALGATDGQIFATLKIACAIRDVASQKAKAAAGAVLGVSEEQAVACDCSDDDDASPGKAGDCTANGSGGASAGPCSCRPVDFDDSTALNQK